MTILVSGQRRTLQWLAERLKTILGGRVYLKAPITHASFNATAYSTGGPTKIENTAWSRTIPATAKALLIQIRARDSAASVETGVGFAIGPTSTYYYAMQVRPIGDDAIMENTGWCPCTDGDIYYNIAASGTDTLDAWLRVWGYEI